MSSPAATRRILIVSLDNLGDTVFASALVPPLRERFPDAHLAVWTKAYGADIARMIPTVNQVIASDPFWDSAPGRGKGRFAEFLRALARVRRERFDIALLAAAPWRTAAAVRAAGVPVRIGLRRRKNSRFLTHALAPEDKSRAVLVELGRVLEPLGIHATNLRYRLDAGPVAARAATLARSVTSPIAALHPFASKRNRCVALPIWAEVAHELQRRGLHPLWIGTAEELSELQQVTGRPAGWSYVNEVGDGSLADTAAALSLASIFAGHDSGPLHIAGALGIPVLGVFAPGEPLRTFPQGVGPARMLARPSPDGISAAEILRDLEPLL